MYFSSSGSQFGNRIKLEITQGTIIENSNRQLTFAPGFISYRVIPRALAGWSASRTEFTGQINANRFDTLYDFGEVQFTRIHTAPDGSSDIRTEIIHAYAMLDNTDTDGDGLYDLWELMYGLDPENPDENDNGVSDGLDDFDSDGVRNRIEQAVGSNPWEKDTDGDGLSDGVEVNEIGSDPTNPDENLNEIPDFYDYLKIRASVWDPNFDDDSWMVFLNREPLVTNRYNFHAVASTTFWVKADTISTFTIRNIMNQFFRGSSEEYAVSFRHIEKPPSGGSSWVPLPGNSRLTYVIMTNPGPSYTGGIVWRYYATPAVPPNAPPSPNPPPDDDPSTPPALPDTPVPPSPGDLDGDELSNAEEAALGTDPANPDTDGDGMPDGWEVRYQLNPLSASDASQDPDGDGVSNLHEYQFHSNPRKADSDADGLPDRWEILQGLYTDNGYEVLTVSNYRNGLNNLTQFADPGTDQDGDGLSDLAELVHGTQGTMADTDGDSVPDGYEVANGWQPKSAEDINLDTDRDGVTNLAEFAAGLLPWDYDSDDDGLADGWEQTNAMNPRSHLDGLLAWWRVTSGSILHDFSGNLNDGRINRNAYVDWEPGDQEIDLGRFSGSYPDLGIYSLALRSRDSYATVKSSEDLVPEDELTLAFRVKVHAASRANSRTILEKQGSYSVRLEEDLHLAVEFTGQSGETVTARSVTPLPAEEWAHVAILQSHSTGTLAIYINGEMDTEQPGLTSAPGATDWPLIFGSPRSIPNRVPDVALDDIRLYGVLLSEATIQALAGPRMDPVALADWDNDGANNFQEYHNATDPNNPDTDGDGLLDGQEINGMVVNGVRYYSNPRIADSDGDGLTDIYEIMTSKTDPANPDTDWDSLWDGREIHITQTNSKNADTDGDRMPDGWEVKYKLNPNWAGDARQDPDEDGFNNVTEYIMQTNPLVKNGIDFGLDSDGDGITDYMETYVYGTDPYSSNTWPGFTDGELVNNGLVLPSGPFPGGGSSGGSGGNGSGGGAGSGGSGGGSGDGSGDSDGDGVSDRDEIDRGTDPNDFTNSVKHALGPVTIRERPKQYVHAGTDYEREYFTYGSNTVMLFAPAGTPVTLSSSEQQDPLVAVGRLVLSAAEVEEEHIITAEAGAFTDPGKHLGSPAESAYRVMGPLTVSSFTDKLERDAEGYIRFTIKREALKELEFLPNDTPTPPGDDEGDGGNGGGGGGSAGGSPGGRGLYVSIANRSGGSPGDYVPTEPEEDRGETYASTTIYASGKIALLTAHMAGTRNAPGAPVPRPEDPKEEYVGILQRNIDNDDARPEPARDNDDTVFGAQDDDIVQIKFSIAPKTLNKGMVTITLPDTVRAFDKNGQVLMPSDLTIDLANPQGRLAAIKTQEVEVFIEGLDAFTASHVSISLDGVTDKVLLLPFEVRDIKDAENSSDDVNIEPITKGDANESEEDFWKRATAKNVAVIEPHKSESDPEPRMPQLQAQFPDLPEGLSVKWRFVCKYQRGNGVVPDRTDKVTPKDTVAFPSEDSFVTVAGNQPWKIYELYNDQPFFGGRVELTYQIVNGSGQALTPEETVKFIIGGKNPKPEKCRDYIDAKAQEIATATGRRFMWFAYAIAKSESKNYAGPGTRYNQFFSTYKYKERGKTIREWKPWFPVYRYDGKHSAGGYGIFQVTGDNSGSSANIPREQLWNWKKNVDGAMEIIKEKQRIALLRMASRRQAATAAGKPLPSHQVKQVVFAGGPTAEGPVMEDAVTIKRYNGISYPEQSDTAVIPGFITGKPMTGDYCYWHDSLGNWALSRFNNWKPPFNYVERVCEEVE